MPTDAPRQSAGVTSDSASRPEAGFLARTFGDFDRDPRYAWTTRRRNRLVLVVTQASVLLAACGLLAIDRPGSALLVGLMFFPLMSLINIGIHGLLDVPVTHLDDIMVRVRIEAKARAHTVLVVLTGGLLVSAPFGVRFAGERFTDDAAAAIVVPSIVAGLLFFVAMLLPTWILAWRLPDADEDDVVEVSDDDSTEVPEPTDG